MYVSHIECSKCSETYDPDELLQVCACGAPLLVRYSLDAVASAVKPEDLKGRPPDLWRYQELLPLKNKSNLVSLGEGMTPLFKLEKVGQQLGLSNLYIKDEGLIPTGTFKARGAAVGVSKAKELGVKTLAMPTNGNAGGAWATYCAKAGIDSVIVMPKDSPEINKKECAIAGAEVYLVNGLISDAGKIVGQAIKEKQWYDASTLKEPYRIEGKKTMGLELLEQMGWEIPDVILYPTGGGVGLIGIYKALKELQEMGWIVDKMPRLVVVQAEGCAPIVDAWEKRQTESQAWPGAQTVSFGINVPKALGDFLVLEAVYETNGCAVRVNDRDTLRDQKELAREEGLFVCPEGATVLTAIKQLMAKDWIGSQEKIVLLNTGIGLKYPQLIEQDFPVLEPGDSLT